MSSSSHQAASPEWAALVVCATPGAGVSHIRESLRSVDWSALLKLAQNQGIYGLLATQLSLLGEAEVPPEIRHKLRERQRAQLVFTLRMVAELFSLLERFTAEGIDVLVTKGPALSMRAYGDPGIRQYVDLDLLVRDRDILRATKLMVETGHEPKVPETAIAADKIPGEYVFTKSGTKLMVELHTEHTFRYYPRAFPIEEIFQRRATVQFDGRAVPTLSLEDELLLICIHGSKHLWDRLIYVADVAAFILRQQSVLDWNRVHEAARKVQAERMLYTGLKLANELLIAPVPEAMTKKIDAVSAISRMTKQISGWLPAAGTAAPGLFSRAFFRMQMRGGIFAGPTYFLRLLFSPTEDDWQQNRERQGRSWPMEVLGRPFRLARKYGRENKLRSF